jgi:hypothetical protein
MIGDRNFIAVLENSRCIWGLLVIRENGARTGAKTGRARGRKRGEHGGENGASTGAKTGRARGHRPYICGCSESDCHDKGLLVMYWRRRSQDS